MIERLKSLFGSPEDEPTQPDSHQLAVAATALMVQLSRVDNDQDDEELKTISTLRLKRTRSPVTKPKRSFRMRSTRQTTPLPFMSLPALSTSS